MSITNLQEPIYSNRVKTIMSGLLEGKSREDLAKDFQLSSWKSLDIYMRRKGFIWKSENNTYIPAVTRVDTVISEVASNVPVKAEQIIRKFNQYGTEADPRVIASEMGFENHREMAEYMEQKGVSWDSEKGNYSANLKVGSTKNNVLNDVERSQGSSSFPPSSKKVLKNVQEEDFGNLSQYLPLLKMLGENKDRLIDLLMPTSSGAIKKYAVPGAPKTKSIYMSDLLARLMTEFSESKNLSQREIVEGAIVEYLRRYGYQLEVEKLLAKC